MHKLHFVEALAEAYFPGRQSMQFSPEKEAEYFPGGQSLQEENPPIEAFPGIQLKQSTADTQSHDERPDSASA